MGLRGLRFIFLTLVVALYLSRSSSASSNNGYEVCQTQNCKDIAREYLSSMDFTVDPCTDFFRYACGNYENSHPRPAQTTRWSRFRITVNKTNYRLKEILEAKSTPDEPVSLGKAKQLYRACMDEQTIESRSTSTIHYYLKLNGGWPILTDPSGKSPVQKPWHSVDSYYNRLLGKSPIVNVVVSPELAASDKNVITLVPPFFELFAPVLVTPNPDAFKNLIASLQYIKNVVRVMARTGGFTINEAQLTKDVIGIIAFETSLKSLYYLNTTLPNVNLSFLQNFMTIAELQAHYDSTKPQTAKSKINWLERIKKLFAGIESVSIDGSEKIVMSAPIYIERLAALLDNTPERDIVNTIHWSFVKQTISYTSKEMYDLADDYEKNTTPSMPSNATAGPRWGRCVTGNELQHALAYRYVQKYFSEKSKDAALEMIHQIEVEMKKQITQVTWMEDATKKASQEKVASIVKFIGYPDWYKDPSKLDERYQNLTVGPFYLENMLLVKQYARRLHLESLRKPVNKLEWVASPYTINAFYAPWINSITFPAGVLQTPFFDAETPEPVNYGAIGFLIAHEISHGFDSAGSHYDKDGNVVQWWSNITLQEYAKKTQCFVDRFNRFQIRVSNTTDKNLGMQTLNENIADSTGIRAVFEAYNTHEHKSGKKEVRLPGLEHLTKEQLFFLSFATNFCENIEPSAFVDYIVKDLHSIGPYRVNGTLANTEAFAESFKCPKGSDMNPAEKCVIWAR